VVNLIEKAKLFIEEYQPMRLRDRRAHYATSALDCLRDQYWAATGEPITNSSDLKGKIKMLIGDAVEKILIANVFAKLHVAGVCLLDTQVPVGSTGPDWDGYIDAMVAAKEDGEWKKYAVEIKTASGFGADMLLRDMEPKEGYLSQLGLYLSDLWKKAGIKEGCLFYVLLSDNSFGELIQIDCKYIPDTNSVTATRFRASNGTDRPLSLTYALDASLERFRAVDKAVASKTQPSGPCYQYKYPITAESLKDISDTKLRKAIEKGIAIGDWQVVYSRYKDKQLATDKISLGYNDAELSALRAEYKRRHPRSKL
jgi:hypothetical protein